MEPKKEGNRSLVRIAYDGSVHKTFRGTAAAKRFANELRVLKFLEEQDCPFVSQVLEVHEDELRLVTTNCGQPVERLSEDKTKEIFSELENSYAIQHADPIPRKLTYSAHRNRFCVIDFELAEMVESPASDSGAADEGGDHNHSAVDALTLRWAGVTTAGRRKEENEDSLIVFSADLAGTAQRDLRGEGNLAAGGYVLAVSDGLGGHAAGKLASTLVVSKLAKYLAGRVGDLRANARPLAMLAEVVEETHDSINRMASGNPDIDGMAATLVCAWFWGQRLHFIHVGDSRIYRWRDGSLTQLTNDHTRVGGMYRDGLIDEREVRNHPMNHVLLQVVGGQHGAVTPQVATLHTKPGDCYLLCSDGVTDGLWNKHLADAFRQSDENQNDVVDVAATILERAITVAGRDDTTLIVARIGDRE